MFNDTFALNYILNCKNFLKINLKSYLLCPKVYIFTYIYIYKQIKIILKKILEDIFFYDFLNYNIYTFFK